MSKNVSSIIKKILDLFLSERFSPETEEKVQRWIIEEENLQIKEERSFEYWNSMDLGEGANVAKDFERVSRKVGLEKPIVVKVMSLRRRVTRIAAILIPAVIIIGAYMFYENTKETAPQILEIATAYGEEKEILLPDGTVVLLRGGSVMKFAKEFEGDERLVSFEGDASFKVARNEEKPFMVNAPHLSVRVLGTEYDLKSFSDSVVSRVRLNSGSVEVAMEGDAKYRLKPNDFLEYDSQNKTTIVGNDQVELNFVDATVGTITDIIRARYGVSVSLAEELEFKGAYNVRFETNSSLEYVVGVLRDLGLGIEYNRPAQYIHIERN